MEFHIQIKNFLLYLYVNLFFVVYVEQNLDCPLPATKIMKQSPIDSNVEFLAWNKNDFLYSDIPRTLQVNSFDKKFNDLYTPPQGMSSPKQYEEID